MNIQKLLMGAVITSVFCLGANVSAQDAVNVELETAITLAETGDGEAQYNLGKMYLYGMGGNEDYAKEALKWFGLAAKQSYRPADMTDGQALKAQYNLGKNYLYGEGVEEDYAEAMKWFGLADEMGSEAASIFVQQDRMMVESEENAANEDAQTQYLLGKKFSEKGFDIGEVMGAEKALKWLKAAAEQGHTEAQFTLAGFYKTVISDSGESFHWVERAAQGGHVQAKVIFASVKACLITYELNQCMQ